MVTNTRREDNRLRLHRRYRLMFLAALVVFVTGAGLLYAVQAELTPPPATKPYDPMPRW
jgi:hypothetical protein